MKAFRFQYQSFLRKLEGDEVAVQKQMSPFVKEYNRIQRQIEEAMSNLRQYSQANQGRSVFESKGAWRTTSLRVAGGIRRSLQALRGRLGQAESKLKPFQGQLKQLFVQKRSLEMLKESHYKAYKKEQDKKEQAELEHHFLSKKHSEGQSVPLEI